MASLREEIQDEDQAAFKTASGQLRRGLFFSFFLSFILALKTASGQLRRGLSLPDEFKFINLQLKNKINDIHDKR